MLPQFKTIIGLVPLNIVVDIVGAFPSICSLLATEEHAISSPYLLASSN